MFCATAQHSDILANSQGQYSSIADAYVPSAEVKDKAFVHTKEQVGALWARGASGPVLKETNWHSSGFPVKSQRHGHINREGCV